MSTHASIGILDTSGATSGTIRAITVHFDGDQVGKRLVTHHATRAAAEAILELGDLSSLGDSLDSFPPDPHPISIRDYIKLHPNATDAEIEARNQKVGMREYGSYTDAYIRDQGETAEECGARLYPLAADWMHFTDASYYYLWISNGWCVALPGSGKPTFVPLGQMVMVG